MAGRSQHNDTLYFNSGKTAIVSVRLHDEKFLYYEFTKRGKLREKRIPLTKLKSFVIYDDNGNLVHDSRQPKRKEE